MSKSVEVIDMALLGECSTTVRFLLGLRFSISILETHRVWLDEYVTVELQTHTGQDSPVTVKVYTDGT